MRETAVVFSASVLAILEFLAELVLALSDRDADLLPLLR